MRDLDHPVLVGGKTSTRRIHEGDPKVASFCDDAEGTLWFKVRFVVPKKEALKNKILNSSRFSSSMASTLFLLVRTFARVKVSFPYESS
jgi:hypothetical protein